MKDRIYMAIDLKSFYASVECVERSLDPLHTNLVVADTARTEKTICLAVSPPLKEQGICGRPRLFEVIEKVRKINCCRLGKTANNKFSGSSCNDIELRENADLELDYITATPRMALYIDYSARIYGIYLKYISPEDIHVYSVDEVFMDVTDYIDLYHMTPEGLAMKIILDVLETTGITATAGIGTNLYLAKVAMDIWAKHISADKNGVRIAKLDEMSYRKYLWDHRPITDFWRIGPGYSSRLEHNGLYTMGDIARCSEGKPEDFHNEDLLYKLFGVNAELLIDHAWGWEPCTIRDIKNYRPEKKSMCSGQVLQSPCTSGKARIIAKEMAEMLVLDMFEKNLATGSVTLAIGYDKVNTTVRGTRSFECRTSSSRTVMSAITGIFDRIADRSLPVRRLAITASDISDKNSIEKIHSEEQLCFLDENLKLNDDKIGRADFSVDSGIVEDNAEEEIQKAVIAIRSRFGKNSILKGMNLREGSTAVQRNNQIGGHHA